MGALKMRDLKMWDHEQQGIVGVENAGLEHAGSGKIEIHRVKSSFTKRKV